MLKHPIRVRTGENATTMKPNRRCANCTHRGWVTAQGFCLSCDLLIAQGRTNEFESRQKPKLPTKQKPKQPGLFDDEAQEKPRTENEIFLEALERLLPGRKVRK